MYQPLQDLPLAFQQLEAQRKALLTELQHWPVTRLDFRQSESSWSAVEILDHIVKSETGTVADLREGLKHPHALGDEPRPRVAELDRLLRSDQFFKVPAGAGIHPDSQLTLQQVSHRWNHVRFDLQELLTGLDPSVAPCGVFSHPFAGWMTFAEVIDHFHAHLYHHEFQFERLRTASAHLQT